MSETMTKQDQIEVLRDWVWKRDITKQEDLERVCKQYGLDWYDDVLAGMEWNCCDRCGNLGDSEIDFVWLDYLELGDDEDDPRYKALYNGLQKENECYCAVCDECINELIKIGGYNGTTKDTRR